MPRGLSEEMVMVLVLGLLFLFVIQLVVRLIGAARRRRQDLGLRAGAPGPESSLPDEAPEPAPVPAPPPALDMPSLAQPTAPLAPPDPHPTRRLPGRLQRLQLLTPWQRAVVWAEILGPPRGLDGEPPLS